MGFRKFAVEMLASPPSFLNAGFPGHRMGLKLVLQDIVLLKFQSYTTDPIGFQQF